MESFELQIEIQGESIPSNDFLSSGYRPPPNAQQWSATCITKVGDIFHP